MSLTRLSLLAGSSLAAAALLTLAPGAALAANECNPVGVAPSANGATADSYTCTGAATYQTTGITYSSQGNLTVGATGVMDVGTVGVNLTGNTTDNVTFTATGTLTGTSGPVVDIRTTSGNITATTTGFTATAAGTTNAIRLESTGGGNITFSKTGTNTAATVNNTAEGAQAAIAAITNGGNIVISTTSGTNTFAATGGSIQGRLRGILAQTSGAGSVTLNITGRRGVHASSIDGVAAVDITGGSGGVNLNLGGGSVGGRIIVSTDQSDQTPFVDALAMRVASTSIVTINNTDSVVLGAVDFSGVTGGGVVFNNFGTGTSNGTVGSVRILAGGGRWMAAGESVFSPVNDVVNMGGARTNTLEIGATIDFGAGSDALNMNGQLINYGAVINNLEAFNNAGNLYFGGETDSSNAIYAYNDEKVGEILSLPGATFTGSGSSHIYLDAILGGVEQRGCGTLTGVADCLDLRDGSTAGSTIITIHDASPDAMLSGYLPEGVTLIDVSGSGTSAAGHFTLDPASTDGYVHPLYGAAFDRPGAFVYLFRYNPETQRHVLISQPKSRDLFDYAVLSGAAQSVWRLTAETVTDRQTDLRDGAEGGTVWLRTAGEYTRRDATTAFEGFDGTFTFDNGYKLFAGTVMGGMDVLSGDYRGFEYVLGAQAGYVSASLDMNAAESSGRFTGATGGVYGSLWSDWFFMDGAVNVNGLALNYEQPSLKSKTNTYVNSVGAQLETGVRAPIGEISFAEPLVTLSYVRTSFEEISLSVGEVQPDDSTSLRGALGMRLGSTLGGESISASYFVAGRGWYEFEGESKGLVHNPGVDLPFHDEFTGAFGEAELGVNIFSASGVLTGFATSGVKWKQGYSAVDLALGVRMAW